MELNLDSLTVDSSGRSSFSGLTTGIDFADAVNSIIAAKRIPLVTLEKRITVNEEKVQALTDLRTLLQTVQNSVANLRGAVTVDGTGNAFRSKQVFASTSRLDSTVPTTAGSLLGVSVSGIAETGSHEFEVRRVATAHKISSSTFASTTTAISLSGSFTISNGDDDFTISVVSTDTLINIRDRINNANTGTTASGITASIISISSTAHNLVLTSDDSGKNIVLTEPSGFNTPKAGAALLTTTANVAAVAQVDKITVSGTIEEGDTYRVTINGTDVDYVALRTDTTIAQIRDGLVTAINDNGTVNGAVTASAGGAGELLITSNTAGTTFTAIGSTIDTTAFTADAAASPAIIQVAGGGNPEIDDVTLTGAVDVGDQFTINVEGTPITYTALTTDTTLDDIRNGLVIALNADPTVGALITASSNGTGVVRITHRTVDTVLSPITAASATDYAPVSDQASNRTASVGNVVAVAQIDTVTLSGAVDTGDVYTVVIDGNTVNYTVKESDSTLNDIRDGLVAAINADSTVAAIVTAAATTTGVFTITADTAGTSFTGTSTSTNNSALLSGLGLSSTFGTGGFRNGMPSGTADGDSKVELGDGFKHVLFDGTEANNTYLFSYASAANTMTIIRGDGSSQDVVLATGAIASGKTETVDFSTFGVTVVLDNGFLKTADMAIDADVSSITNGTGVITDSTITITDSVGDISALSSTTLTFSNFAGGNDITITATGGFTATGVDLSGTGGKTVVLADGGGNTLTVQFTVATQFDGNESAATITLNELENLVVSNDTQFDNVLKIAQTARFTADGLKDVDRFESNLVTDATVLLNTYTNVGTSAQTFKIRNATTGADIATINYDGDVDTLTTLAATINGVSGLTGKVVTDGARTRLEITKDDGTAIFIDTDTGTLLSQLDINNDQVFERTSNTVSDVFAGVTLTLFQAEEDTVIKIDVETDLSTVKTAIQDFVTAYNSARFAINEHNQTESSTGTKGDTSGVLFGNSVMNGIRDTLANIVGLGTSGVSTSFSALAQIGVTLVKNADQADERDYNTLEIDDTLLDKTLISNIADVRRMFAFDFTSSDPNISLVDYGAKTTYKASGYTLNIGTVQYSSQSTTLSSKSVALDTITAATGSGTFKVNGTSVAYDTTTDTMTTLAATITSNVAGVTATAVASGSSFILKLAANDLSITIDTDSGNLLTALSIVKNADTISPTGTTIDGTAATLTINGRILTVTSVSGAEGLKLFYDGVAAATGITLNFTDGIGAEAFFALDSALNETSGILQGAIATLDAQNILAQKRIDTTDERLERLRGSLIARFISAEIALASMNTLIDSMKLTFEALAASR